MDQFNILDPPREWIDFRCAIHGKEGPGKMEARKKFFESNRGAQDICGRFGEWRYEQVQKLALPIEHIQRWSHGELTGEVFPMMIVDIDYWLEGGMLKRRKEYMPFYNGDSPIKKREPGEEG